MKTVIVMYEIDDNEMVPEMPGAEVIYSDAATGIKLKQLGTGEEAVIRYARWFDKESSANWHKLEFEEYNWLFLRTQQNWANDILRARGHLFLNDVHDVLGMPRTALGAIVGWVYSQVSPEDSGNFVDFGCWEQQSKPLGARNDGAILLDFNVQGPILHHIA